MKKNSQKPKIISAEEFEAMFDRGDDLYPYVDWSKAKLVIPQPQRVNVDFPPWVVSRLDQEARRRGISRQALIKFWIVEHFTDPKPKAA